MLKIAKFQKDMVCYSCHVVNKHGARIIQHFQLIAISEYYREFFITIFYTI